MKKKVLWILAILAAPLAALFVLGARNPGNSASAERHYSRNVDETRNAIIARVPQLRTYGRSWKLIESSSRFVKVEVPVLFFTDDLTIILQEDDAGVLLRVASKSRVGKGDLGENQRHIRQLLAALDKRLLRG